MNANTNSRDNITKTKSVQNPGESKIKYQKIGDILIVKRSLTDDEIKELVKRTNCRTIVKYSTHITGDFRTPRVRVIYSSNMGSNDNNETETIHKEHGCRFKIDVSKVMWSMGNIEERKRMAHISNPDETVVDMFAGIGYFSIPMAKYSKPKKIYSIEINPNSYHYLCENIKLNKLDNMVAILSDNRKVMMENMADRIIMGYVLKTHKFLDKAFEFLKDKGVIHYHDTVAEKIMNIRPIEQLRYHGEKNGYKLTDYKINKIKKYSPGVWHVVVDAEFEKNE
ncbi:MAG: tRNA wybutosine-synthesizing protein 2 [Methanothermococcus sp.]|jgi:tRNA wybutosine-synthesizing protein 2|uniref:tRNA(Phe) (4-demethylwyosine(37)-C(7)) aminocarboxypropyltransferase Taw2 n=1 Tax=Methanothermococcus thermolithotrophicus TaxID=2186 RepID=UPI0003704C66|nr:tRNA wybutosine-synthesizing protein 2 [Methanothermococcus sp.]MDK2978962.1 tRNA wybutosine-synthesizing protein 2 [Bacteroidales bacterium]MDK2988303.1 tRNA wybutosine-synthesizing protein 2 [Methanothermococcus sp.]